MPELKFIGITILGLLFKYVILKWFAQQGLSAFNWLVQHYLIKYPRELAIWLHYDNKKKGLGHQYPNPKLCPEGGCASI